MALRCGKEVKGIFVGKQSDFENTDVVEDAGDLVEEQVEILPHDFGDDPGSEYGEPGPETIAKIAWNISVLVHAQGVIIGSLLVLHRSIVGDYEHIEKLKEALKRLEGCR